ncbi:hypothetical protein SAMN05443287_10388 [Micromonospora phaseoli]|uniref:Uncharacterized protein n=1 Tax=Micromonospora phaseoli TaxID=1144548 RepID=A0A1H6WDW7_9ACTN|nr:hypothetical protein [Micromonospora phaseoli]PZW01722.1 hypothetical protein CLV64_10288 [Micromonospora phaseoli]GIJ80792.1 hypothetical protein Xph01_52240 [Micromonospora phaseoli]SEJ13886.1 hypothetical protein SAMN05443287_10388 [Micromonospora phaseoli]
MRQEEQQLNNDHPEAVRSNPVAVPSTVDDREVTDEVDTVDEQTDRDRSEAGTDRARPWDGRPGEDSDEPDFHQPAPVPTAFGATTVGGAVAASALASPRPEDEVDPRDESTARPGDGAVDGEREGLRADPTAEFDRTDDDRTDDDLADDDLADDVDGTDVESSKAATDTDDTVATGYGSTTPTMVDPDAQSPNGGTATAGAVVPAGAATLFDEPTAQGFRDRWRDVQLRFVDDPKAAVGEAQSLVDEAMEALSAALAEHKNKLGGWQEAASADTEQLRVAVREYRDFLDRVLGR